MTEISEIRNIVYRVRNMGDRATKLGYLKRQPGAILKMMSGTINADHIGPSIFNDIQTGQKTNRTLEQVIEVFDVASKASGNDKRAILSQVVLDPEDKEFVRQCLFENLLLGVSVPVPEPEFGEAYFPELARQTEFDPIEYIIEEKFDGIRAIAINNEESKIFSRNKKVINAEIIQAEIKDAIPFRCSIDGELVAKSGAFQDLDRHSGDAILRVFDIPFVDGKKNMKSFKGRRAKLESILVETEHIKLSPILDLTTMWQVEKWVEEKGAEGVMAKDPSSKYAFGSRKSMIKFKPFKECSARVIGITAGTGKRANTIGAIEVIGEGLTRISRVGTGFSDQDLLEVERRFKAGEQMIVEVKFQQITIEGKMRHPVFLRIRK